MKMNKEGMRTLFGHLAEMQLNCAPIELSIGKVTDGIVESGYVVLKEAPPVVTSKLIGLGYHLDITKHGVIVSM